MRFGYFLIIILLILSFLVLLPRLNKNKEKATEDFERFEESGYEKATFAGGCFWGVEKAFEETEGVVEAISGYTGGNTEDPSYEQVSTGNTGHYESVRVYYDKNKTSYEKMLEVFWNKINPTDSGGQSVNRGSQYKTAIFYHDQEQKEKAEKSKKEIEESGLYNKPIVTELLPAKEFYPAEKYHQNYFTGGLKKCYSCSTKGNLTDLQYRVTQSGATEMAFNNEYWDNKEEGIYVDVVSGEVLFSSMHKYDSGTGWPSFYKALEPGNIVTRKELDGRTEVRSKKADSHLGHLFMDGPEPTGKRYCINSAALRFIPRDNLEKEGYGKYKDIF